MVTISGLLRELILRAVAMPVLYAEGGPDERVARLILDELRRAVGVPDGDVVHVRPFGELDLATAPQLEGPLTDMSSDGHRKDEHPVPVDLTTRGARKKGEDRR